jgi:hypothetical protein
VSYMTTHPFLFEIRTPNALHRIKQLRILIVNPI